MTPGVGFLTTLPPVSFFGEANDLVGEETRWLM